MPGLKRALDTEIERISGNKVRETTRRLRKASTQMRKELKALRSDVNALRKEVRTLRQRPEPTVAPLASEPAATSAEVRNSRPTAESVKRMRKRFSVSQKDFARLLGVTPLTVYLWERQTGRLNLRSKARTALYNVRSLTRREVAERLAGMPAE